MFSLIDVSPHLIKPPFVLMRENRFPDCPKLFTAVSIAHTRTIADRLWVGWRFTGICRITGMLWAAWAVVVVLLVFVFAHGMYHHIADDLSTSVWYFGIRCVDVEVGAATALFVLLLVYEYTSALAQNLAQSCLDYLQDTASRPSRRPAAPSAAPGAGVGAALQR